MHEIRAEIAANVWQVVVEEGQLRRAPGGHRLYVRPDFDRAIEPRVRRHFDQYSTVSFDHYPVRALPGAPCGIIPVESAFRRT